MGDLQEDQLGEPMQVVTLKPGDMLYFPRGVIYLAKTTEKGHSTHVTLSTYQQNSWGDFLSHAMEQAIENALEDDINIRGGLPINFRSFLGTSKNMGAYIAQPDEKEKGKEEAERKEEESSNLTDPRFVSFKEKVKNSLVNLVEHIDVNKAADVMCSEFMACRLPPYGHGTCDGGTDSKPEKANADVTEGEETSKPEKDSSKEEKAVVAPRSASEGSTLLASLAITDEIKVKFPDHFRVVYVNEDDDDADMADTPHIKVLHSLLNDRFTHMVFNIFSRVGCLNFDVSYSKALVALSSSTEFIAVKDLMMDTDDEKLLLANKLATDGLLEVKSVS